MLEIDVVDLALRERRNRPLDLFRRHLDRVAVESRGPVKLSGHPEALDLPTSFELVQQTGDRRCGLLLVPPRPRDKCRGGWAGHRRLEVHE
jgi:hypothetical protein